MNDASAMPRWSTTYVTLVVPPSPAHADLSAMFVALERGAARWNARTREIGAPTLRVEHSPLPVDDAVQDGTNAVLLRTRAWCPGPIDNATPFGARPRQERSQEDCYDLRRQAITHLYLQPTTGLIAEADIDVNGVAPAWRSADRSTDERSLEALLVHELGHVLGLDHSCGLLTSRGAEADRDLQRCDSPAARSSVMYPDPLEAGRDLHLEPTPDAVDALRTLYYEASLERPPPVSCASGSYASGSCASVPRALGLALAAAGLMAILLALAYRLLRASR